MTPEQRAEATAASFSLSSPAIQAPAAGETATLPVAYTCDGKGSWPELRWQGVPAGTAELVLFILGFQPVNEKLFFNWAVAGLDPELEGIEAGRLPRDAIVGRNGFGGTDYSICPDESETYVFSLYALPEGLSPRKGFDPTALRKEVLDRAGDGGLMVASYTRGKGLRR